MKEPEYRYIKGEGWQSSYAPVTYRVKEDEVCVGDVILGWSYQGRVCTERRYPVTSIVNNLIIGKSPSFSHYINGTVDWFEVER